MAGKVKTILRDICFLVLILVFATYAQINHNQDAVPVNESQTNGIVLFESR